MRPRSRSITGALIAILALPVFLGLLACIPSFPVPIGDAEKSRIEPSVSGMWVAADEPEIIVFWFIPYDKRTWLLSSYVIETDEELCDPDELAEAGEVSTYDEIFDRIDSASSCLVAVPMLAWKTWLTELGGRQFITLEIKSFYNPAEEDNWWMVYGMDMTTPDVLRLWEMDAENDAFSDLDENEPSRRQFEKVFKKRAADPEFYDSEAIDFFRVQDEDLDAFAEVVMDSLAL